jgi:hypothetical protein
MIRFRRTALLVASCFTALLLAHTAHAAVPSTMSYQGVLTDGGGVHVPDGTYALTFRLYDASTNGVLLWTETQASVPVAAGLFSVVLGSATPLGLPFDRQYWLGIAVGADPEMTPRTSLTSVPYALATRTPLPGVAQALYAGSYPVIGNANFGNPIQLARDVNLDFTAPADGYVVVQAAGHVTVTLVTPGTSQYAMLQVSETTGLAGLPVNSEWGYYQWVGFQFAPNNGYFDWPFALQRVFLVTAGAHRYSFCTALYGSYSPTVTDISNLSIIATFYPTSYGAVVTAPAEAPLAGPASPAHGLPRPGANVADPLSAPLPR